MPHLVPLNKDLDLQLLVFLQEVHNKGEEIVKIVTLAMVVVTNLRYPIYIGMRRIALFCLYAPGETHSV